VEKYVIARHGTDDNIMMRRKDSIFMLNDEDMKADTHSMIFCFLNRVFSIMKTKINQQNAQINSGLIYY